jgi:hypothetical protein
MHLFAPEVCFAASFLFSGGFGQAKARQSRVLPAIGVKKG